MPSESYRLDAAPPPTDWFNATLIRWGFIEAPVNPMRRVVVIWSHGFAETAVWMGETELGRFADAALLRRGVTFTLDDKTNLRVMLMGNRLVITRNGKPLARIGDPQPSINFGVDFLYFCALFYGIPGLLFLFLHNPDLGLGGWNILTGAVLAAIAVWASRRPLPALWVGAAAIVGRMVFSLRTVGSPAYGTPQWAASVAVSVSATLLAIILLIPVVRAAVVATLAKIREA
jgi:hypothetical protein